MSDADEIKKSTDIFNIVDEYDKEIRENISEATGIYFPRLLRPKEELGVLFAMDRILGKWNEENNDTLSYTTDVIREVPKGRSTLKRLVDYLRGTWYGSVIEIGDPEALHYDYINPKKIVVLFPEYRKLADELKVLLKPRKGVEEDYESIKDIFKWTRI